jgi:hypothetical protein
MCRNTRKWEYEHSELRRAADMNILEGPVRVVTGVAEATTAAAGAVAGAAAGGVAGAAQGLAGGVRRGLSVGSHSTPAAAVTFRPA